MDDLKFLERVDNRFNYCDEENATHVMLDIKTYHGLDNVLRIYREKIKQMGKYEKAEADKHGYVTVIAKKKEPFHGTKKDLNKYGPYYMVKKTTPHPLTVDLATASYLIERDLTEFYHYIELPLILKDDYESAFERASQAEFKNTPEFGYMGGFDVRMRCSLNDVSDLGRFLKEMKNSNADLLYGPEAHDLYRRLEGKAIGSIDEIAADFSHGRYTVTYTSIGGII